MRASALFFEQKSVAISELAIDTSEIMLNHAAVYAIIIAGKVLHTAIPISIVATLGYRTRCFGLYTGGANVRLCRPPLRCRFRSVRVA